MQVKVDSIRVRRRIRQRLEDIDQLADSMERLGQLHPIVITRRRVLVSGRRRLEAAKSLGWATIEASVLGSSDAARRLELELEENMQRVPLAREEIALAVERLERLRHPGLLRRLWNAIARFVRRLFRLED